MYVMKNVFRLNIFGARLWMRDLAKQARGQLLALVEQAAPGQSVVIDAQGVEVFDFSFANEFFGKALLGLSREHPDRFLVVENLNEYTRENLARALESLNLAMVERTASGAALLGKSHPADMQTIAAIGAQHKPVTAAKLKDILGINLTAINERLSKLVALGVIRRSKGVSLAGREQYEYTLPA